MVNGVPVVAAPEEIDASTADWLGELLLQAHCCGHGTFVVDMTRTRFCDSSGDAHQPGLTVTTPGARLVSRGLREPTATARLGTTRWRRAP
jgi:hypothetical protein